MVVIVIRLIVPTPEMMSTPEMLEGVRIIALALRFVAQGELGTLGKKEIRVRLDPEAVEQGHDVET